MPGRQVLLGAPCRVLPVVQEIRATRHYPNQLLGKLKRCHRPQQRFRAYCLADDDTSIADLQLQLNRAVQREDYALAARIRDSLQQQQTNNKLAVEEANRRFYKAFSSGSVQEMLQLWGNGDHVQCLHPGSNCIAGRDDVMQSWAEVLKHVRPNAFKIDLEDVRIHASDDMAFVTCVEVIDADDSMGRVVATNIFQKQDGRWVIIHHQGGSIRIRPLR